ncbi:MAG: hypothetical protein E5X48_11205 [Mesorhizobium sp.]|uniref:hypothetical protein n=1 Tax=Mesorhizobium sp. TaxID=1871066 RepID=UPI001203A526|nr:hypothetical protein [Mesorhizobium sp.]TIQ35985.1 MAG: hypothetical protein E5X48_11205 [Mesorhizobium sp.]
MSIPSLSDYMVSVERRVASTTPDTEAELAQTLLAVSTAKTATDEDLFNCIAFGRGCHALAESCREQGDQDGADLYHAFGQDLLTKATCMLAELMAIGIHRLELVRH